MPGSKSDFPVGVMTRVAEVGVGAKGTDLVGVRQTAEPVGQETTAHLRVLTKVNISSRPRGS